MKIFDWMHRKLHRNVDYSMVSPKKDLQPLAEEERKAPPLDTKPLLLHQGHVALIDALDDWADGILAIGTFGLDHFPLFDVEYSVTGQEYSATEEAPAVEESDSPAVKALAEELDEAFVTNNDDGAVPKETLKSRAAAAEEINVVMESKKKAERTTLADLFYAEAGAGKCNAKVVKIAAVTEKEKKKKMKKKSERSLGRKKLVPWKGEDSPPTAKLHRLLTKILKRKIHPEFDHGAVGEPAIEKHVTKQEWFGINGANESVSMV